MHLEGDAAYYVDMINRLLGSGNYGWAEETLTGIANTIAATGKLTGNYAELDTGRRPRSR